MTTPRQTEDAAGSGETTLAMARRHVVEGDARVIRQIALIARLREQEHDTAVAEDLLAEFEAALVDMRGHLHALEAEHDAR